MTTKMVFHGSDIEKICAYYHLNKEDIVKFGAKRQSTWSFCFCQKRNCRKYRSVFFLSGQRLCQPPKYDCCILSDSCRIYSSGKWLQRVDLPAYPRACTKAYADPRTDLFRIFQRTFFLRKHTGILSSARRTKFHSHVENLCKTLENGYDFLILCIRIIRLPLQSCRKISAN